MRRTKRKSLLTHLDAELRPYMRDLARGQPGIHPDIWTRWRDIVGPDIARRAGPLSLRRGVLVVAVSSSAWLQELSFWRARLLDRLAEEVGPGVVAELRFVFDPAWAPARAPSEPLAQCSAIAPVPLPPEVMRATAVINDDELRSAIEAAIRATLLRRK